MTQVEAVGGLGCRSEGGHPRVTLLSSQQGSDARIELENLKRLATDREHGAESHDATGFVSSHADPATGVLKNGIQKVPITVGTRDGFTELACIAGLEARRVEPVNVNIIRWPPPRYPHVTRLSGTKEDLLDECVAPEEKALGDQPFAVGYRRCAETLAVVGKRPAPQ